MPETPDYRTLYSSPLEYESLCNSSPSFAALYEANGSKMSFTSPPMFKSLTLALLRRDFNLELKLPDDRLCPPVPNRLNYILWLHRLVDSTGASLSERFEAAREVVGMDIGTGASCIYPLLGCRIREGWRFVATDIDEKNLAFAERNIAANGLSGGIRLFRSSREGAIIPLDAVGLDKIDFLMTNPPFYTSTQSMLDSASSKSRPPLSACTGAEVEMVFPGGEVAFVTRIIHESMVLRDRVQWYSAMLGKLDSVQKVLEVLIGCGFADIGKGKMGTGNWAVTEFVQGGRTRRWAVAWSWMGRRPCVDAARGTKALGKQYLPFPSLFSFELGDGSSTELAGGRLDELMKSLDLRWRYKPLILTGVAFATKNVWSRAARRSKDRHMDVDEDDEEDEDEPALAVKITIAASQDTKSASIDVRWLIGRDSVLFESFCGMLKRELTKK